jgi:hypothetical protein
MSCSLLRRCRNDTHQLATSNTRYVVRSGGVAHIARDSMNSIYPASGAARCPRRGADSTPDTGRHQAARARGDTLSGAVSVCAKECTGDPDRHQEQLSFRARRWQFIRRR